MYWLAGIETVPIEVGESYSRNLVYITDRRWGHGLAHEVLFHSLEVSHRLCGIICLAAFDTCFSFDRHEQTITAHFEFCFNGGWFHLASSADYALHERFLLLKSGSHRLGSGWYVVIMINHSSSRTGAHTIWIGRPATVRPRMRKLGYGLSSGYSSMISPESRACRISSVWRLPRDSVSISLRAWSVKRQLTRHCRISAYSI